MIGSIEHAPTLSPVSIRKSCGIFHTLEANGEISQMSEDPAGYRAFSPYGVTCHLGEKLCRGGIAKDSCANLQKTLSADIHSNTSILSYLPRPVAWLTLWEPNQLNTLTQRPICWCGRRNDWTFTSTGTQGHRSQNHRVEWGQLGVLRLKTPASSLWRAGERADSALNIPINISFFIFFYWYVYSYSICHQMRQKF